MADRRLALVGSLLFGAGLVGGVWVVQTAGFGLTALQAAPATLVCAGAFLYTLGADPDADADERDLTAGPEAIEDEVGDGGGGGDEP